MKIRELIIDDQICFKAYGVVLGIRSPRKFFLRRILNRLGEILPDGFDFAEASRIEHLLVVECAAEGVCRLFRDGEQVFSSKSREDFLDFIAGQIRLTVAEFAVGKVFLHAGVVGWNGRALIVPGSSFSGKTTLVAELIKNGAVYYSDEYAVLDENGLVYPFAKKLSLRGIIDDYKQVECSPEIFGAEVGGEPLPVGMILIARYEKGVVEAKNFQPELLSAGQGMIEILANSVSIRHNPKFVLKVLNKFISRVIIAKSRRGEAKEFASRLIKYLNGKF